MKRKKILRRLEKVEAILSQVLESRDSWEPGTQQLLEEASAATVRVRTAVAQKADAPSQKKSSSSTLTPQPAIAAVDERRNVVPTKKRRAVKRKGVQSETAPTAVAHTG